MRRLLPTPGAGLPANAGADPSAPDVDLAVVVAADERRVPANRPWVMLNMIAALDGAVVGPDGLSGALGGPADQLVFRALRSVADIILAGAGTVRTENYGPPRLPPEVQAARRDRGQAPLPRIAVVSGSLRLDPEARLFQETSPEQSPIVLTTTQALKTLRTGAPDGPPVGLADVADLRECGDQAVDLTSALGQLRHDAGVVLVEGGPTVNGQLIAADLIDEFCLTLSPTLVGRSGPGVATGAATTPLRRFYLHDVLEQDDFLFLRYRRSHG